MKPAQFDFVAAETLDEALSVLGEVGEDARPIAGGQSLGPMLNLRLAQPEVLIDITRAEGLGEIEWSEAGLTVGARASQAALLADPNLATRQPLLALAMPWIGHVQTRARGTVCGSLANADPAAELPLLMAMCGGVAVAKSADGAREIPADDFFLGMFETALEPEELLTSVRFPDLRAGAGVAFRETAERHGDFAIVAVAAIADSGGVTFGLGGAEDRPVIRRWDGLDATNAADAVEALAAEIEPQSDPKADAAYRRRLARLLGRQAVDQALERRHAV